MKYTFVLPASFDATEFLPSPSKAKRADDRKTASHTSEMEHRAWDGREDWVDDVRVAFEAGRKSA